MSLWKSYLTQKLIDDNHPTRKESACLNALQTKAPCSICQNLCPHGVFDHPDPIWANCDNCTVCVAACPTRCLAPAAMQTAQLLEVCRRIQDGAALACSQHEGPSDAVLPCLASFPWELLAFFALQGKIQLLCGNCETCEKKQLLSQWEDTLSSIRAFLGDSLFEKRIRPPSQAPSESARQYSRRDAFSMLFSKTKRTAGSLLPASDDLIPDGTIWRQLLVHRLRFMESDIIGHWQVPSFNESCSACGICVKLCQTKALHKIQDPETPFRWHMAVIPWRCTNCGLCEQVCPSNGITPPHSVPLADPTRPLLHTVSLPSCKRCGEPSGELSPSGLCPKCQTENPKQLIW